MHLNVYKVDPKAKIPNYETRKAACFDLSALILPNEPVVFYIGKTKHEVMSLHDGENGKEYINLMPGERAMIRTGLVFDIPEGYSIRLHPRSGMALKYGLMLANCEGIVDEDYVNETKLIMLNTSNDSVKIYHGDRIAQGEVVKFEQADLYEVFEKPATKTNRTGGFGSTGIQ